MILVYDTSYDDQSKLSHLVLCISGVMKTELLGGVVKDAFDCLYYIW
jgi:hypothetical protein